MKKLFSILLLFPFAAVAQKGSFSIDGNVKHLKDGDKVYLSYYNTMHERVIDSSLVSQGVFQFKGTIIEPTPATLMVNVKSFVDYKPEKDGVLDHLGFYLEPYALSVIGADSLKNAVFSGGPVNKDDAKLQLLMSSLKKKQSLLFDRFGRMSEEERKEKEDKIQEEGAELYKEEMALYDYFIKTNPTSFISLGLLRKVIEVPEYLEAHRKSIDGFSPAMLATPTGMMTKGRMGMLSKLASGTMAKDFELNDVNGKPVKLSDFRGKYVLLDFWASWCVPCRKENPNVRANYQKYKDSGFTVLSVSIDQDKNAWKKAVAEDKLEWTQLCDEPGDISASGKYAVASIPANFLIDPSGKIVASQLKGKDLGKKLEEIFNK